MHLQLAATGAEVPGSDIAVSAEGWIAFVVLVVVLLLGDLFLFHRDAHEIAVREAAVSSFVWISIGLAFGGVVWWAFGGAAASQYYTGYVIEKSLSVDNVFVWAVILGYFAVPRAVQHRVLFWGVFGALVLRGIFIFAGVALLERLEWLTFLFGAFLVFTAYRVATEGETEVHPERNPILKFVRARVPMTDDYRDAHFFVRDGGRRFATPMLAVLIMVEVTDLVFAVDSIPAILAISRSPFVVLSSNVFAILGLRALFFLLAGFQDRLVYLNEGLGVVLAFVGLKMIAEPWIHVPTPLSLAIIVAVLTVTVVLSLRVAPGQGTADDAEAA